MAKQGVEIHKVPGTHLGMLGEPSVQILAEKFVACLEQAQMPDIEAYTAEYDLRHATLSGVRSETGFLSRGC